MKSKKQSTAKARKSRKSTPAQPALALPPGWDELAGLRETYLYHFSRPEDVAALRHVIALVLELHLESPRLPDPDGAPPAGTPTRLELAAVTRDLRYCQGFLQQVARGAELSELSPVDAALARFAGKQADALALIAWQAAAPCGKEECGDSSLPRGSAGGRGVGNGGKGVSLNRGGRYLFGERSLPK